MVGHCHACAAPPPTRFHTSTISMRSKIAFVKEKTMKTLWLLGGLGLGAGLMYLLDPEKGEERRDVVRGQLAAYGRQTEGLLDDTTRTLGRQAQAVLAKTRMPFRRQPEP